MNVTTLNMTTLDDGRIIKKGGGGTPTPPSGESASTIEYLDLSQVQKENIKQWLLTFSILAKYSTEYGLVIMSPFLTANITIEKQLMAVMIDFTMQMVEMGNIGTIKDAFIAQGYTQEDLDAIPHLTKEEFYNLD